MSSFSSHVCSCAAGLLEHLVQSNVVLTCGGSVPVFVSYSSTIMSPLRTHRMVIACVAASILALFLLTALHHGSTPIQTLRNLKDKATLATHEQVHHLSTSPSCSSLNRHILGSAPLAPARRPRSETPFQGSTTRSSTPSLLPSTRMLTGTCSMSPSTRRGRPRSAARC